MRKPVTLPETNIFAPENGWKMKISFRDGLFGGASLRECRRRAFATFKSISHESGTGRNLLLQPPAGLNPAPK